METLTIYGNVNIIDDYSYENNINDDDVYDLKDTGYIFRFAKNLVEREFISQGMEEFFKKEYEKDGLASVNFELSREKNKSILTMTFNKDVTDKRAKEIMDSVIGQYADGFGKNLANTPFYEDEDDEEVYDDEHDDYVNLNCEHEYYIVLYTEGYEYTLS